MQRGCHLIVKRLSWNLPGKRSFTYRFVPIIIVSIGARPFHVAFRTPRSLSKPGRSVFVSNPIGATSPAMVPAVQCPVRSFLPCFSGLFCQPHSPVPPTKTQRHFVECMKGKQN